MIVRYTRGAVQDIEAIAKYIRDRNPSAAVQVRGRIEGETLIILHIRHGRRRPEPLRRG